MQTISPRSNPTEQLGRLETNHAVARRLIRRGFVPHSFLAWLHNPANVTSPPAELMDTRVSAALDVVLKPILVDASVPERREAQQADVWLASISLFFWHCEQEHRMHFAPQLLASSLLPLYRVLATGHLQEGFRHTRDRLAEGLALLALCHELGGDRGDDLLHVLEPAFRANQSPEVTLRESLQVDLRLLGRDFCDLANAYDATADRFTMLLDSGVDDRRAMQLPQQRSGIKLPEWSTPDLLWRLAGELLSQKSDMVLPRPWIDTPVPWNSIGDHWNSLARSLSTSVMHPEADDPSRSENLQPTGNETIQVLKHDAEWSAGPDGDLLRRAATGAQTELVQSVTAATRETLSETTIGVYVNGAMPPAQGATDSERASAPTLSPESAGGLASESQLSKVMIAEIRSHSDPVFVNVVKRQIATGRQEDRTVCLVDVIVQPEDESHHADVCGVRENGMTLWQYNLVNWLANQPNVIAPYAFLTSGGELILCVLDLERGEMTSLLRRGLVEILTGRRDLDESELSLSKVNIPARYHAGIASTSSPGSNFTPQQLIEPAIRCLSAARHHGSASIKSIEVF